MVVYKYLKKEHLRDFKDKGSVRVNTLHDLRSAEVTIRDEFEGRRQFIIGSDKKPTNLSVQDLHKLAPIIKASKESKATIELEAGAIINSNLEVSNAFVFCTSLKLDEQLSRKLGYDSHYRIIDIFRFAEIAFEELNKKSTLRCFQTGEVKYADKEISINNSNKEQVLSRDGENSFWEICFTKPKKFMYQKEFRIVFVPWFGKEIKPLVISSLEFLKCCAF
jgi:hypothetical protein